MGIDSYQVLNDLASHEIVEYILAERGELAPFLGGWIPYDEVHNHEGFLCDLELFDKPGKNEKRVYTQCYPGNKVWHCMSKDSDRARISNSEIKRIKICNIQLSDHLKQQ